MKTLRTTEEKVQDPETLFERFKETVAAIAAVPKSAANGKTAKQRRKPAKNAKKSKARR